MNCSDIQKLLKHFQSDMLPDEEYQEYVSHLGACEKCREYISRFGFLSNQLWELGQVKPPSDLAATIFFTLQNPKPKRCLPQWHSVRVIPPNLIWATLISIFIVTLFFFGQFQSRIKEQDAKTTVTRDEIAPAQVIVTTTLTQDQFAKSPPPEKSPIELYAYLEEAPAKPQVEDVYKPLHWHMELLIEPQEANANGLARMERHMQIRSAELGGIRVEIERLKALGQESFKQHYSPESQEAAFKESQARARALIEMVAQKDQVEADIIKLRSEYQRFERLGQEEAGHQRRLKEKCRAQILSALSLWRVSVDYNADDAVVFTAQGAKVEQILKEILLLESMKCSLSDFTKDVLINPNGMYSISISLPQTDANIRHWHMEYPGGLARSSFENMILRFGGRIKYDSKNVLVFLVPGTALDEFTKSLKSKRVTYSEYGDFRAGGDILMSNPVTVSVYFAE